MLMSEFEDEPTFGKEAMNVAQSIACDNRVYIVCLDLIHNLPSVCGGGADI